MAVINRFSKSALGFSLIEVLIAVFVLAVGILGVGGLQLMSKRSNLEAVQRSTAAALTQDLAERMRANPDQLATYTNGGVGRVLTGSTLSSVDCSSACTEAQLASFDLFQFEQALAGVTEKIGTQNAGGLFVPLACIDGPNGGAGTYTIAVAWRGRTRLSNPSTHACGAGLGLYDTTGSGPAETDVYRRVIVVSTYIAPTF
jgi:type IV pilus assembly protein PilV